MPTSAKMNGTGNTPTPRERLEALRIEAEIAALTRPPWKTIEVWRSALAAGVLLVGTLLTWSSGWFSVQQQKIENSNLKLEAENSRLAAQKESLLSETAKLEASRITLNNDLERLHRSRELNEHDLFILTNELVTLRRTRDETQLTISNLTLQVARLGEENAQFAPIIKEVSELRSGREELERKFNDVSLRLAKAHNAAFELFIASVESGQATAKYMEHPRRVGEFVKTSAIYSIAAGRLTALRESDMEAYPLAKLAPLDTDLVSRAKELTEAD